MDAEDDYGDDDLDLEDASDDDDIVAGVTRMAVDGSLHDSAGPIKPPSIATLAAAARRGGVDGTALRPTGRVVAVSEVSPRRESIVGYVGFAEDEDAKRLKGGETKVKGKEKEKETTSTRTTSPRCVCIRRTLNCRG